MSVLLHMSKIEDKYGEKHKDNGPILSKWQSNCFKMCTREH